LRRRCNGRSFPGSGKNGACKTRFSPGNGASVVPMAGWAERCVAARGGKSLSWSARSCFSSLASSGLFPRSVRLSAQRAARGRCVPRSIHAYPILSRARFGQRAGVCAGRFEQEAAEGTETRLGERQSALIHTEEFLLPNEYFARIVAFRSAKVAWINRPFRGAKGDNPANQPPAKTKADAKALTAAVASLGKKRGTALRTKSRSARGKKRAK
jgi:hypothetical protein